MICKYTKCHYMKINFLLLVVPVVHVVVPVVHVPSMGSIPMCFWTVGEGGMGTDCCACSFWVVCKSRLNKLVSNDIAMADHAMVSAEWSWIISWGPCKLLSQRATVFKCSPACHMSAVSGIIFPQWVRVWISASVVADSSSNCFSMSKILALDSQNEVWLLMSLDFKDF